ncbi:hypothetical protein C2E25_10510 [Geothermobacter hydrogeniphilus]|uniref:SEC-C motif-containing protein n=1 Tax=Geothermobacter hydrogeniphilus TaxID=1969733 RepID=A0A2K2H957_9BACT|nr:DUF1186 domain-containing protein [Geothermobacter hydrogeniphilus]PNU19855.1 hypothetical protein C2E25_10510 [Geothermobacter hydrogeniphilus]
MTIETALESLKPFCSKIPTDALNFIRSNWSEAEPLLLAELDHCIDDPSRTEQSALFFYALFLCAQQRCEAAFERYLRILRLPNLLLDNLIGDVLTENMKGMLARTCGDRVDSLKALVEDETVNEFARSAALRALLDLVLIGSLAHSEMAEYCTELLTGRLEKCPSHIWDAAVFMAEQLHLVETLPLIETAFQQGLMEPGFQSLAEIKRVLSRPQDEKGLAARRETAASFDMVREMSLFARNWEDGAGLAPEDPAELLAEPRAARLRQFLPKTGKVGRNEPCPCGSGKKYKKCCIDQKTVPIPQDAIPASAHLTPADEWIGAGYYYLEEHWPRNALSCWQNAWPEVKKILPETVDDPDSDECNRLFTSCDFFSNWLQDCLHLIEERMTVDLGAVQFGLQFCREVAERFSGMRQLAKNNLQELTAHLLLTLGDRTPAFSLLERMIEEQPNTAQGYVVMADLFSVDAQRFNLRVDFARARQLLLQALDKATDCEGWDVEARLEYLTESVCVGS